MSSPSFQNIDRWLFEYAEGNLSPAQVEQLDQFLFLNPDLELEKEAWESAQVSQSQTPNFLVSSLQRSNPLPLFLWTGLSVVFLISASIFAFDTSVLAVSSRYTKQVIDLAVIDDFNEVSTDFLPENKLQQSKIAANSIDYISQTSATTNKAKEQIESTEIDSKSDLSFVSKSNVIKRKSTTQEQEAGNNSISEEYVVEEANVLKAPELNAVISSLTSPEMLDYMLAESNKSSNRAASSKSSGISTASAVKRKFKSTFKKIKRMADQPVALRNYKDPYFHAPFMTGYQANFGMVGTLLRDRFQATSRGQFLGSDNEQLMNTLSWDSYIYALRGGLGIDVNYSNYQNGALQNFNAGLTYSPKFSINNNISIEPALRFKMGMIDLDTESSIIGNQIEMNRRSVLGVFDQGAQPIGSKLWYRDVGAGVLLNTKWFYAGFNIDNVRRHYNNFYSADIYANHQADLNMTTIIGSSYSPRGRDVTYSGYLLHQKFADLDEVWGGGSIRWSWLEIGAGASNNLDFGASAGINMNQFSVHYNIDYLESRLLNKQLLSHQVTMRIILKSRGMASRFLSL